MTRLAWTFLRSAGWARASLLAGTTAVATALLLVALSMLLLPSSPAEALFNLVAEPGLRYGTAFATAMLVLPLLLMLHQAVRLGTASRERRLAALRLAGATPAEVRRIGAVEVGIPVAAGAIAGPLVFTLLRLLLGGGNIDPATGQPFDPAYNSSEAFSGSYANSPLALIPTSVTPAWWQFVTVVAAVAALGIATGALASRHLIASPLGVTRRARRPAPRPWGLLVVGAGLGALAVAVSGWLGRAYLVAMVGGLLVVLGAVALAPWVAYRSGRRAAGRTSDPATLIAAGHLVSDPRPAGRAAAAVGAIGIISGGAAVMEAGVFFGDTSEAPIRDPFFLTSFLILGGALLLVLLVTASTLSVHAAESLVDRRRVLAGLVAAGTPVSVLQDALRREAMLTSLPLSLGGLLVGTLGAGIGGLLVGATPALDQRLALGGLLVCVQVAVTVSLTWLAIRLAAWAVRRPLLVATAPANLRTE